MIAADTSTLIAYLEGARGEDVTVLHAALTEHQLVLPPVVLAETLSDPALPPAVRDRCSRRSRCSTSSPVTGNGPACCGRASSGSAAGRALPTH